LNKKNRVFPPELLMAISVLAASTGAIFIRLAQREAPSLVVAAYRLGIGALVLAPLTLSKHLGELKKLSRRFWLLSLFSGMLLAFHFASWISSLEYTSVSSSVVLVSMSPLFVALLSTFILHEPLTKYAWAGLIIAVAGSVIVALESSWMGSGMEIENLQAAQGSQRFLGNSLALAGAVFVAGYLIIGRSLRAMLSFLPYTFLVFASAALILLLMAAVSGQSFVGYTPITYLWFAALGLIPQIAGHAGFNWALRYLPASFVSIALLGEPIGSSLLAMVFLQEAPTLGEIVGGVLILSGIYLAARRKTK